MKERRLLVTVKANDKTCGQCECLRLSAWAINAVCGVFGEKLKRDNDAFCRCASCLDAEVRE